MPQKFNAQIDKNPEFTLLEGDGLFSYTFLAPKPDSVITLKNGSIKPDLIGDTILTELRLVAGDSASTYEENKSQGSKLAELIENLRQLTLKMKSEVEGLRGEISLSSRGLYAQFYDSHNNLQTDLATIAGKLLAKASSDTASSILEQTPSIIRDSVTTEHFKSIIEQSPDKVIQAISNKVNGGESIFSQTADGFRLDGKLNAITGTTYIEKGVINSSHITDLQADKITFGTLDGGKLKVVNINVQSLTGEIAQFIQAGFNGVSNNLHINGDGMFSTRNDGSISAKYLADGIQIWGGGRWAGSMSYWGGDNGKGVVLWAKRGFDLNLGYATNQENTFLTALSIAGGSGDIKVYTPISTATGNGFVVTNLTVGNEPGVYLKNKNSDCGLFIGNWGTCSLIDHGRVV